MLANTSLSTLYWSTLLQAHEYLAPSRDFGTLSYLITFLAISVLSLLATLYFRSHLHNVNEPEQRKAFKSLKETKLPVLIVGAGPTGLTLAAVLTRYGVPVRIIEKKERLSRHTKATNLMQRNQEFMFALGLLSDIKALGGDMRRLMVHAYGKTFGPRTMRLLESPFSDVILCGQHNFEAVLAAHLSTLGIEIEFSMELRTINQNGEEVTAQLVCKGVQENGTFCYLVGCDGRGGNTRKFTSHDFEPQKTGVSLRQVDCELSWRRLSNMEQMWMFYFDKGFAVVVPLPGGLHRILSVEPRSSIPERDPTLNEMQTKLREVSKDASLKLSRPDWFSYTDLSMGLASGLRDGRIFLAGDAGNPVLPNGGQGMNTGITDAYNLGWKLAAACRYGGSNALLDTYNEERHATRSTLQAAQFNSLKYTTLVTPKIVQAAFRWIAEPLLNLGGEYKLAQAFSELTIDTKGSALTLDRLGTGGLFAGSRALNASVVQGTITTQLYNLIYKGSWTLLCFTGCGSYSDMPAVLRAVELLQRPDLQAYVVTTKSLTSLAAAVIYDLDEEAHRVYKTTKPTLFLIRPDGHIAVRVKPPHTTQLAAYLAKWIPNATQAFR